MVKRMASSHFRPTVVLTRYRTEYFKLLLQRLSGKLLILLTCKNAFFKKYVKIGKFTKIYFCPLY